MAKTLPTFPSRTKITRYPWNLYLNGSIWQLVQGVDFTVSPKALQSAAFAHSKRLGRKLQTSLTETTVTLQSLPWKEKTP